MTCSLTAMISEALSLCVDLNITMFGFFFTLLQKEAKLSLFSCVTEQKC